MQASEFIKKVKDLTGAVDDEQARTYIKGVFSVLRDRISPGGAANLADQLPKELRELWEPDLIHGIVHTFTGVEHWNKPQFIGHIQNAAHLPNMQEAERVARAVFAVLKEQITDGEIFAVRNQLPEDIAQFWMESEAFELVEEPQGLYGSEEIGPAAAEVFRHDDQLKEEIEQLLAVNDEIDESTINVEVYQGKVRLKGTVRSEHEREDAIRAVKLAWGVTEVTDDLKVQGQ